jgi:hypothetical protein
MIRHRKIAWLLKTSMCPTNDGPSRIDGSPGGFNQQ